MICINSLLKLGSPH